MFKLEIRCEAKMNREMEGFSTYRASVVFQITLF